MALNELKRRVAVLLAPIAIALLLVSATLAHAGAASDSSAIVNLTPVIYANDVLYGTVVTRNTDFSQAHPAQSLDTIYTFSTQNSVADAAPGEPGFNGGRWEVRPVTWNTDSYLITNATNVLAAAARGDLTIGDPVRYFVCTLIPLS